jgi:hypothetical protein
MDCRAPSWEDIFVEQLWRSMKYEEVRLKACANGREAGIGIGQRRILQPPAVLTKRWATSDRWSCGAVA